MNFRKRFDDWVASFFDILASRRVKPRSKKQKKRDKESRIRARRHQGEKRYRAKKERARRRSSYVVAQERFGTAIGRFIARTFIGILFLPADIAAWRNEKNRKARASRNKSSDMPPRSRAEGASAICACDTPSEKKPKDLLHADLNEPLAAHLRSNAVLGGDGTPTELPNSTWVADHEHSTEQEQGENGPPSAELDLPDIPTVARTYARVQLKVVDDNIPKSTPKCERDQYVRKRMRVAGSYYCSADALAELRIGSYIDMIPEPDNPYDKNAIMLMHYSQKIGYVAKTDLIAIRTAISLGRVGYAIITDVINDAGRTVYEYEAWLSDAV